MNIQIFKTANNLDLIIKSKKSSVVLEMDKDQMNNGYRFNLEFTPEGFKGLFEYIEMIAFKSWDGFAPKPATSLSSDYDEYYDRELDNNGYLAIWKNKLSIERPSAESERVYKFNKRKMESFVYDLRKAVDLR